MHIFNLKFCTLPCSRPKRNAWAFVHVLCTIIYWKQEMSAGSSFIKRMFHINVESNIQILLISNDVCYLCHFGSVGATDLIPYKAMLSISVKHPSILPHVILLCCSINTEQCPLLRTDLFRQTPDAGMHSQDNIQAGTALILHNRQTKEIRGGVNRGVKFGSAFG